MSRRFWNEIYLDLDRLPEMAESPRARDWLERPETRRDIASHRAGARASTPSGRPGWSITVLTELAATFFERSSRGAAGFDRWVDEHPLATDYARFRAVVEQQGTGWHDWPERLREGRIRADDYDVRVAARHVYAQWSMDRQLAELSAGLSSRGQRLYLDLPVGAGADGFDTWIDRDAYAWGTAVGRAARRVLRRAARTGASRRCGPRPAAPRAIATSRSASATT